MDRKRGFDIARTHPFLQGLLSSLQYLWLRFLPSFIRAADPNPGIKIDEARSLILQWMLKELEAQPTVAAPAEFNVEPSDCDPEAQKEYQIYYVAYLNVVSELWKWAASYVVVEEPPNSGRRLPLGSAAPPLAV